MQGKSEKYIQQFDQFIKTIDKEIIKSINSKNNKLTKQISGIHRRLWENYKEINGTSAGLYGISEYIVFSTFKIFIEKLNKPQKFISRKINKDLRYFELKKNNKGLIIYRAASLKHFPIHLKLNRAPDIAILKKEGGKFKFVTVIEIKNYLDKGNINSAIDILSQIREAVKDSYTKYVIFSFGRISVKNGETQKRLMGFQENENNFLITNEAGNEKFKVIDLSKFLNIIKNKIVL